MMLGEVSMERIKSGRVFNKSSMKEEKEIEEILTNEEKAFSEYKKEVRKSALKRKS